MEAEQSRVEDVDEQPEAPAAPEAPKAEETVEAAAGGNAEREEMGKETSNPLVMEEGNLANPKSGQKGKKKKKAATAGVAKDKTTTAIDLINARLKQLEKKQPAKDEGSDQPKPPVLDPMAVGLKLHAEGGESMLREAYQKAIQESKKLDREYLLLKRRNEALAKEKDRMNLENAEIKADQQRSQIRCLEIQKQIKTLKEAADKMEEEKETQRKELEAKFQSAIDEITAKLEDGNAEREALRAENLELSEKVKAIEEECGDRFGKYEDLHEEKSGLLLEKKKEQHVEEQVALGERQKNQLCEETLALTTRSCAELRLQIKMYKDRMGEFEQSIEKSKGVFGTFGAELLKMKEHVDLLQTNRDTSKAELVALEKQTVQLTEERQRLRRAIDQQEKQNTKNKEAASRLNTKRATWKPYLELATAWRAASTTHSDPNAADSSTANQSPSTEANKAPSNQGMDKENTPPATS